jgi:hypothetical protein
MSASVSVSGNQGAGRCMYIIYLAMYSTRLHYPIIQSFPQGLEDERPHHTIYNGTIITSSHGGDCRLVGLAKRLHSNGTLLEGNLNDRQHHLRPPHTRPCRRSTVRQQRHHISPVDDLHLRSMLRNYYRQRCLSFLAARTQLHSTARATPNPPNHRTTGVLQPVQLPGALLV